MGQGEGKRKTEEIPQIGGSRLKEFSVGSLRRKIGEGNTKEKASPSLGKHFLTRALTMQSRMGLEEEGVEKKVGGNQRQSERN